MMELRVWPLLVELPGEVANYLLGSRALASIPSLCSDTPICSALSLELAIAPLPPPLLH